MNQNIYVPPHLRGNPTLIPMHMGAPTATIPTGAPTPAPMPNSYGLDPHALPWPHNMPQPVQRPQLTRAPIPAPITELKDNGPFGSTLVVPAHGASSGLAWHQASAPEMVQKSLQTPRSPPSPELVERFGKSKDGVTNNKYNDMLRVMGDDQSHGGPSMSLHHNSKLSQLAQLEAQRQAILQAMTLLENQLQPVFQEYQQRKNTADMLESSAPLTSCLMLNKQILNDLIEFNASRGRNLNRIYIQNPVTIPNVYANTSMSPPISPFKEYRGNLARNRRKSHGHNMQYQAQTYVNLSPKTLAHKKDGKLKFPKHDELRLALNRYQNESADDILAVSHIEKSNVNQKWTVSGLVDPNKHLSTLDFAHHIRQLPSSETDLCSLQIMDIVNYHHWIPSVFQVNEQGTECRLLSEIAQLDPYRYGDTLYPWLCELFLHQIPQFENVLGLKLRGRSLKVAVRIQDYQLDDCQKEDCFLGNFHKEGLYEDIAAVGLYYYQIDDGIKGGELEISSVVPVPDDPRSPMMSGRTELKDVRVAVQEGTSLVFDNVECFHRVRELWGNGSRKMIAFNLLRHDAVHPLDASQVVVNWKHHTRHFVEQSLREIVDDDGVIGNEWLVHLMQAYVVGDKQYIKRAMDDHRRCKMAQSEMVKVSSADLQSNGYNHQHMFRGS